MVMGSQIRLKIEKMQVALGPQNSYYLFLFKSHHFRTYFLYMIRYNNIVRPDHDARPPAQNLGVATPNRSRIDAYAQVISKLYLFLFSPPLSTHLSAPGLTIVILH